MGFSLGGLLGGVGGILGGVGAGDSPTQKETQISGYDSLPKELQDFMMEVLFPDLKEYATGEYQGQPMRAVNSQESDPIFGSANRMQYSQQVIDQLAGKMKGGNSGGDGTAGAMDASAVGKLRNEMMGRDWAGQTARGTNYTNNRLNGLGNKLSNDDYELLGIMAANNMAPRDATPGSYAALDMDKYKKDLKGIDPKKISAHLQKFISGGVA